jgi:hypothetical protein
VNTVLPSISGEAVNGATLTYVPGEWTGADSVTHQWIGNGMSLGTGDTYVLTDGDASRVITIREVATNAGGSTPALSAALNIPSPPVKLTDPVISGSPTYVGDELIVTPATWEGTPAVTRQWTGGWIPIDGATGTSYALTMNESGLEVRVDETATAAGFTTHAVSTAFAVPPLTEAIAPANTGAPSVSDGGADAPALTAVAGTWTGTPAPTVTRQWVRAGVDIAGETGESYTKQRGDTQIAVRETATNIKGSASATSAAVDPLFPAYMRMVAKTGGGMTGYGGYAGSSLVPSRTYAAPYEIVQFGDAANGLFLAFATDGNLGGTSFTLNGKTFAADDAAFSPSTDDGEGTITSASYQWNGNSAGLVDGGTYDINWTFPVPVSAGSITMADSGGSLIANTAQGAISSTSGLPIVNFYLVANGNFTLVFGPGNSFKTLATPFTMATNGGLRHTFFPSNGGGPSMSARCFMQGNVFGIAVGTEFTYDIRPATLAMCVEIEVGTGLDGSSTLTGYRKDMGIGKAFYANGGTPGLELLGWYHHGGADTVVIILNKDVGANLMVFCNAYPSVFTRSADPGFVYTASPAMAQGMDLPTKVGRRISMGCGAAQEPA